MSSKPFSPQLKALIDAERDRADAPADQQALARGKLAALLGPSAGLGGSDANGPSAPTGTAVPHAAGAAATAAGLSTAKLVGALLVGALVGGAVVGVVATRRAQPTERIVYVDRPVREVAPAPSTTLAPEVIATTSIQDLPSSPLGSSGAVSPVSPLGKRGSTTAAAPASASSSNDRSRDTDLSAERALIERARSALARGDGAAALLPIAQHEREFPSGQLAEEREVLAVQALATAGRTAEATARGARFRKAFPGSLMLPIVDEALR